MDVCLNDYIQMAKESISLLYRLVAAIKAHQDRCNAVRVGGTTASVGGALLTIGCIVAAPFAGGASVVALAGAGATTALVGGVANLGTDVVDMI